jgi:hypothetical protein
MPFELITMLGGSITGFIFRYMSERAKERHDIYKRAIGMKQAEIDSADSAATRVPLDAGKWVRRVIVVCVLFGAILAPFILSVLGLSTIVQIDTTGAEFLFGLFGGGTSIEFVELPAYLLLPEVMQTLTAIVGFYFGNAAAARKT